MAAISRGRAPTAAALLLLALLALGAAPAAVLVRAQTATGLIEEPRDRAVGLDSIPNCVPVSLPNGEPSSDLRGGISGDCMLQEVVSPGETVTVTFDVPPSTAAREPGVPPVGTWDLMAQLRSIGGFVSMEVMTPRGLAPVEADTARDVLYKSRETSESYFGLSGDYLAKNPGEYKIKLYNEVDSPAYVSLQMHTPLGSVRLIPEEVEVINDLRLRCCPPGSTSQMCSSILPTVTSPTRTANQDLCRLAPNHCGPTGRLRQLILAGAGLNCGNMGLPASFSRLTELRTLDLARNAVGGGTAALAGVIASMPSIKRVYMRYTNITGPFDCGLVNKPSLTVLSLSGNDKLTGAVPACFLSDPTLEELYLSFTGATGELPDVVPSPSALRVLFAMSRGAWTNSPALTGTIPSSLANAGQLAFLDLSNNGLEGAIPPLGDALLYLNVSANSLGSLQGKFPNKVEVFDAAFNAIAGSVPTIPYSLMHLNLAENDFDGPLPGFSADGRRRLSRRRLQQAVTPHRRLLQTPDTAGATPGVPLTAPAAAAPAVAAPAAPAAAAPVAPAVAAPAAVTPAAPITLSPPATVSAPTPAPPPGDPNDKPRQKVNADQLNPAVRILPDDDSAPMLRYAGFGLNHLTGTIPDEWVTTPGNLHTLDVSNNDMSGPLPTQWDLPQLAWLDISGNLFEGSLPASLGALPSIVHIDAHANVLGGELGPFADQLAADTASSRLVYLDLSDNYFEGPIPDSFADSVILNSVADVTLNGKPAKRLLDLSNNSFSGAEFPLWVVDQLFLEKEDCGGCELKVAVNGPDESLACPTAEEVVPYKATLTQPNVVPTLQSYGFTCKNAAGEDVPLLSVLDGSSAGSRDRRAGKGKAPDAQALGESTGRLKPRFFGKKLSPGAIAGIVIGSLAGVALLAGAAAFFALKRTKNQRAGWTKERLNGAGETLDAGSGGRHTIGGGWGARVAKQNHDAPFGVMPH